MLTTHRNGLVSLGVIPFQVPKPTRSDKIRLVGLVHLSHTDPIPFFHIVFGKDVLGISAGICNPVPVKLFLFHQRYFKRLYMVETSPYLIAVDGGGTRCRFAMITPGGQLDVTLGSANVFSDRSTAVKTLNTGLAYLADQAGMPRADLSGVPVYAGLAGVTDSKVASEVAQQLQSRIVQIEDDRRSAVVGALGARNGCLIGIGTGSFLARQIDGDIRFAGGYGPLIGDEASGNWLGAHVLRRVLLAMDGLCPHSPLTRDIGARFGNDPFEIVAFSGASGAADIAGFAPQIVAAAKAGDPVARDVMRIGAEYIVDGLRAIGCSGREPVCAVGGVAPHYIDYLPEGIRRNLVEPAGTALDGAVQLARRLADRVRVRVP